MGRSSSLAIIILAAGKGTRMQSALAKVMHKLAGQPMINRIIDTAEQLSPEKIIIVTAPGMDEVAAIVAPHEVVVQHNQLGTADAVKAARGTLKNFAGTILVLYGDGPLYTANTLRNFLANMHQSNTSLGFLGMEPDDPTGYGRLIIREGFVTSIVEEKEATSNQKKN